MRRPSGARLFRVLVQVSDLGASHRFYETLLGSRGRAVGGGRVYFDCGPVIVALRDANGEGGSGAAALPEPLYFSTDDLEGAYRRARELGCLSGDLIHNDPENPAGEIVVRPWGERSFYAQDPDGNRLCFVDAATRFTGQPGAARHRDRRPAPRPRRRRRSPRGSGAHREPGADARRPGRLPHSSARRPVRDGRVPSRRSR
jgi:catechol 2,3-dioxygenase-like lactoylglutathione lyase family enzyme